MTFRIPFVEKISVLHLNIAQITPTEPPELLSNIYNYALLAIIVIAVAVALSFIIYLTLRGIRGIIFLKNHSAKNRDLVFLEVLLPKTTPDETDKEMGRKQENEIVAASENIYQIINHYSRMYYFSDWMNGAPSFSFEIIKHKGKINFFIGCPKEYKSTIEKQIISTFNRCRINIHENLDFVAGEHTVVEEMIQKKQTELPFRTYTQMAGDPMNNLVNALEIAEAKETVCIQMVLSPIGGWWQTKGRKAAHKLQNEKDKNKLAKESGAFEEGSIDTDKKDNEQNYGGYLTPNQQNLVKRLEEKASRPGFRFCLRIGATAESKKRSQELVNSILPAFKVYELEPFNGLMQRLNFQKKGILDIGRVLFNKPVKDFVLRKPAISNETIVNVEEANSIWHLPNYMVQSPSIDWMLSYKPALPTNLPQDPNYGIYVGEADGGYFTKPVYLSNEDRTRHSYVLGGSGSGKSVFMTNMMIEDIKAGHGICVVDPHGEAVDDLLFRMPKERLEDVVIISPAFLDSPIGLNVLHTDPRKPEQKTIAINNLFQIWDKMYDMKTAGGPMFETFMKNAARLVMGHAESGNTLLEIGRVFSDPSFRKFKISMCPDREVVDFWVNQASKGTGDNSLENMTTYITSKLAPFITNDFIRPMIGQSENTIDFRRFMDNKKIILVKLEKGIIGETSMYLLGMVIISNIMLAGMGRSDRLRYNMDGSTEPIAASGRPPFFVYIDEMQNFLFDSIPQSLEEIRKYKVGFHLAHQFVKQIIDKGDERIKDSIMANTGSKFIFNCGIDDAEYIEKEFKPILNAKDLMNPERYTCNARVMLNGQKTSPFNLKGKALNDYDIDKNVYNFLIEQSKLLYGTPVAEVERDIKTRSKVRF